MDATPADATGQPVIRAGHTPDMADAMAAFFLDNADAGHDETNDEFVAQLLAWHRAQR